MKQFVMGNEAVARGAIAAGVAFVSGYPGTPSTEVLESVARLRPDGVHVEWSVNEKAALECAAGAAYAGAYSMVTMKQVGLNVASDPLMSLAYVGIEGAMVIVVADDPGPISSQTEQDTRHFAQFAKLPVFDPSSVQEAYGMIGEAFEYSHHYRTPVIFRPTTRICHGYATITLSGGSEPVKGSGFQKSSRWVIFPRLAYQNHIEIERRNAELTGVFSGYERNLLRGMGASSRKGIASGGVSYAYACERYNDSECRLMKVSTPHPFPEALALKFLDGLDEVLVLEELDPVIERELLVLCGRHHLNVNIRGKLTGDVKNAGENTVASVSAAIDKFLGLERERPQPLELPPLPVRPPVLCAGCPHRASFYAVKRAMKGQKAVFSGDIGCYTLGNAMPLDMVDTCLCMGAGVTVAQGLHRMEPDAVNFAFIGDSTFFHTGIPGVINALYNHSDIVVAVLDNGTTAMTGNQPHPGTGRTAMGDISARMSIPDIVKALGVEHVATVDPFDLDNTCEKIREFAALSGVRVLIFKSPCISVSKPHGALRIDEDKCRACGRCVNELGCPAIFSLGGHISIDKGLCTGCGLCVKLCRFGAITKQVAGLE